ncbi:hypothetical protein PIB30_071458 [Stylosanthes scabra]|uniref:Uncharacterized protein n=1 Tax=Stylosanthes scabra TaxID=79078 RepID=A0ABU6ZMG3_9FABA|nr:hypothetical protein [Stylosanthes scabra]
MARTRHLHRVGARLSLSWSLRNGVARARHLGHAAAPPTESFLIKKGGRGRAMQMGRPRGYNYARDGKAWSITSKYVEKLLMRVPFTMINHHQTFNTNNNPKGGVTINKGVGTPTNNLNITNPTTTTIHHKIPKILDTNLHIVGNHTHQTPTLNLLMKAPFEPSIKRAKK